MSCTNTDFPLYAVTRAALCGRVLIAAPFLTEREANEWIAHNVRTGKGVRAELINGGVSGGIRELFRRGHITDVIKQKNIH